jgi:hypothetical protein
MGEIGHQCDAELVMWHFLFYVAVFLTILAAPLAH